MYTNVCSISWVTWKEFGKTEKQLWYNQSNFRSWLLTNRGKATDNFLAVSTFSLMKCYILTGPNCREILSVEFLITQDIKTFQCMYKQSLTWVEKRFHYFRKRNLFPYYNDLFFFGFPLMVDWTLICGFYATFHAVCSLIIRS